MGEKESLDVRDNTDLLMICATFREDIKGMLKAALKKSAATNEEQFLSEVLTGKCPRCGSDHTKNCENVETIGDFSVGLCVKCGYLWCSECGKSLVRNTHCNHWDICGKCDAANKCDMVLSECDKLKSENVE